MPNGLIGVGVPGAAASQTISRRGGRDDKDNTGPTLAAAKGRVNRIHGLKARTVIAPFSYVAIWILAEKTLTMLNSQEASTIRSLPSLRKNLMICRKPTVRNTS